MTHRHLPAILFEPNHPTGYGSGGYIGRLMCPACGTDLDASLLPAALDDLRARGMGARLLWRVRKCMEGER